MDRVVFVGQPLLAVRVNVDQKNSGTAKSGYPTELLPRTRPLGAFPHGGDNFSFDPVRGEVDEAIG